MNNQAEWTVYECLSCKAWHRQLFLLDHDQGCVDETTWRVTTRPLPAGHRE